MDKIREIFNSHFSYKEITLPEESYAQRKRGKIIQAGWVIWYLFGSTEAGEFLDYYASHRMTNDRHIRIYSDGNMEDLPTISQVHGVSEDPEENERLKSEYYEHNRNVAELLEAKGFGPEGDEPGLFLINRSLHLNEYE